MLLLFMFVWKFLVFCIFNGSIWLLIRHFSIRCEKIQSPREEHFVDMWSERNYIFFGFWRDAKIKVAYKTKRLALNATPGDAYSISTLLPKYIGLINWLLIEVLEKRGSVIKTSLLPLITEKWMKFRA